MARFRRSARVSFVILLIAGCIAMAVAPMLRTVQAAPPSAAAPAVVVINEFRFLGSGDATTAPESDEFVELFNRSCTPVSLDSWTLKLSSPGNLNVSLYDFPTGAAAITLAPGQYYLVASSNYDSPTPAVPADATYTGIGIRSADGGVALVDGAGGVVDQVGLNSDGYHEGTPLDPLTSNLDQGYRRRVSLSSGQVVDVNDNKEDFDFASTSTPKNQLSTAGTCGIPTQTISGNAGVAGAVLQYTDGTAQSVTADASGNYTITVSSNFSGAVTPVLSGYAFTPPSKTYTNVLTNQTGQNYSAAVVPTTAPTRTPNPTTRTVIINEIGWGGTQAFSSDQWIELYNPSTHDVDLADFQLIGPSGTIGSGGVLNLKGVIPAKGFFVIEKRSDQFNNLPAAAVTQVDTHLNLSTYGETLYLRTTELIDTANIFYGKWVAGRGGTSTAAGSRASMERHNVSSDIPDNWYTFAGPASAQKVTDRGGFSVKGTPGYKNWAFSVTATPAPTGTKYKTATPRPPTPFAHMVINEFLPRAGTDWNQDRKVDVFDEFIEVKNLGPIDVDLRGWKLDVISSAGNTSYILPSVKLKTDERTVFYRTASLIALPDSGGTVRLTNTRGIVIDARTYGPVESPDQTTCRIPDGYYWRFPCFPTPGLENSLTGSAPIPPPIVITGPPPCLLADTVLEPFRLAECNGFGAEIYNPNYWDDQSGFAEFPVRDALDKNQAIVK